MKRYDINLLKRIVPDGLYYRYVASIPRDITYVSEYYPIFSDGYHIYDYTESAKYFLKPKLTISCYTYAHDFNRFTKIYNIDEISLEQAQEIIDRNSILFKQIQLKIKEDSLLKQINEL